MESFCCTPRTNTIYFNKTKTILQLKKKPLKKTLYQHYQGRSAPYTRASKLIKL